ncbi:MAG: addiction module antidote protein [Advenella sp.]|uniref:Putative addiction module antidote protein n=1 Tax=Advenella kashmirensis TaxID=310575 RepID=A0A356LB76_9BURK|nr:addiction module antidote protein [Advenella sp. FME57]HBP28069.1 putative addiction module antidote protein [Advenella kashmirensis]
MNKVSGVAISEIDASEYLTTSEDIVAYLNAVIEEDDGDLFLAALGDVAKALGMAQISEVTGLGRESLYKTFSGKTKPRSETVNAVLKAVGASIQLTAKVGR